MLELRNSIEDALNDEVFAKEAASSNANWVGVEFDEIRKTLLAFIDLL